jgi:hypothetical protein
MGALGGWNVQFIEKLRNSYERKLGPLNFAARVAIIVMACVVVGGLIFWVCNELIYFYIARSYSEELADAYDLNRGFARAVLWASFAAIVVFAGYSLSFSKQKRRVGYAGILTLLIGHSLLLGRMDANFRKSGEAEKCYVMTHIKQPIGLSGRKPVIAWFPRARCAVRMPRGSPWVIFFIALPPTERAHRCLAVRS